ncbi:DUF1330 domain-containing protein [Endozoicomonas arenosclerae]|uniref:DUF1330 domain-containing protein n=1 Tax=Endozoicomonas arenosclerae TaxID=1633495 RepID=UPI000782AD7F|nr:DUF1330 domain-containing protein [Endozoicomonas arenosclerae]
MSVNVIALATINPDEKESARIYSEQAKSVVNAYGGKASGRYSTLYKFTGCEAPQVTLVMEFQNAESAKSCFESPEYQNLLAIRDKGFLDMKIYLAE